MGKPDAPGQDKLHKIYVNTIAHTVAEQTITFEEVVALANMGGAALYSVSYSGGKGGKDGMLLPGKKVPVEDEMMFDVTPTDKS